MDSQLEVTILDNGSVDVIPKEVYAAEREVRETSPLQYALGIHQPGPEEMTQLRETWQDLLKQANYDENEAIKRLNSLEASLGAPKIGQTRLDRLYGYMRINKHVEDAINLRSTFHREINEGID